MQIESNPTVKKNSETYQIDLQEKRLTDQEKNEKPYLIFGRYITIK